MGLVATLDFGAAALEVLSKGTAAVVGSAAGAFLVLGIARLIRHLKGRV